jgi:hypothetical protein
MNGGVPFPRDIWPVSLASLPVLLFSCVATVVIKLSPPTAIFISVLAENGFR